MSVKDTETLVKAFCEDVLAKQAADQVNLSYKSTKLFYNRLRMHILEHGHVIEEVKDPAIPLSSVSEEAVFGVLKDKEKVIIVPAVTGQEVAFHLLPPCKDIYKSAFISTDAHIRIHRPATAQERQSNLVDNFWTFTRVRLQKFKGIAPQMYYLYLRECQFRFNLRHKDIYQLLLYSLKKYPL